MEIEGVLEVVVEHWAQIGATAGYHEQVGDLAEEGPLSQKGAEDFC